MQLLLVPISFEEPMWLLLLLVIPPIMVVSWKALKSLDPPQRYLAPVVRTLLLVVLIFCLAEMEYVRINRNLAVLFLVDRSHSIPKSEYGMQEEFIRQATRSMPDQDEVGVLSFDGQTYVEQLPMRGGVYFDLLPETQLPDRTDISGAIRMAMALFPSDMASRIVLVTDGNNNAGDVLGEVQRATASGIAVDIKPVYYQHTREVIVEKLTAPSRVKEDDLVPLRAIITAQRTTSGDLVLTDNDTPVELPDEIRRQTLQPGQNLVWFKVPVKGNVPHRFELQFVPDDLGTDTLVQNNRATAFSFVGESDKVLLLTADEEEDYRLIEALRKEKLDVDAVRIESAGELDLLQLMRYSTVILSNIEASWFTDPQHEQLVTYVHDMGGGLIMTGGHEAFGAGGWIGSPVEDIMPVDFEIKHRQVIPRGALVVIAHSTELPRGEYWGKLVAEKSVETISSKDYFGLLSYSHMLGVTWDVPLQVAANKSAMMLAIKKMNNGDMPDYATTMKMAVESLMDRRDAAQRHVIIISDGDASPPTQATIDLMVKNKITCSTVGVGYGQHVMEQTLRKVANDTGGKFYAVNNPKQLPQIFVKESKVVRRPLIMEEPFTPQLHYALSELLAGFQLQQNYPPLDGMVMTSPKNAPGVEMPLVRKTSDGTDPVLAHWQTGLGRTLAFTSGYWRHWGSRWTQWPAFSKLWAQMVRWTMSQGVRANYDVSTQLDGNRGRIVVHALDDEANYLNFQNLHASVAKPGGLGTQRIALTQVGPGRYEGEFDVSQTGQYVANIVLNQQGQSVNVSHTGLSVPYSPEYKELSTNDAVLQKIADISGGYMDIPPDAVFRHDLPPTRAQQPIWDLALAWIFLPLLLLDVAVRRLASTVALSIYLEVLLVVVLLFGTSIASLDGWSFIWAVLGVLLFGEMVGWSIRWRSIRPTIEFLTHNVTALAGAGQTSAGRLGRLKGARRKIQDARTTEGMLQEAESSDMDQQGTSEAEQDRTARFDVGDERAQEPVGDWHHATGSDESAGRTTPQPPGEAKEDTPQDAMSRLRQARKRAREEMQRRDDDTQSQ